VKDDKRKETLEKLEQKMFDQLTKAAIDLNKYVYILNMMNHPISLVEKRRNRVGQKISDTRA